MRVAVIDLGTFSAVLLIAEVRRGRLVAIHEERRTVDLADVGNGSISGAAAKRADRVIRFYSRVARDHKVDNGLIVATAALRHAKNRSMRVRAIREVTPYPVRVLTAREEANYGAAGALLGLRHDRLKSLIVDVGGGSTELMEPRSGEFTGLRIGASWATTKWAPSCPRNRARRDLYYLLSAESTTLGLTGSRFAKGSTVVGLGGTITTLAAIDQRLSVFDVNQVHGHTLTVDWIAATAAELSGLSTRAIRALVPFDPSRARVLTAGTYLWSAVLNRLNADRVTVSARGLRWGVAAHLAGLP